MRGEEIRKKRDELGLTQGELAEMLGISTKTLQNYEYGEVIPKSKHVMLRNFINGDIGGNNITIDVSPPISSGEIPQSQLEILVQAIDRLTTSEVNSENVKELIAQGRQQTDNITRLLDLLCQKGVDGESLIDREKGGLNTSGNSDDNSASDADRANVG